MPVLPEPSPTPSSGEAFGPCGWEPDWSCCTVPTDSEAVTGAMLDAAAEVLWALSGRQFGACEVTLRPCKETCDGWSGWNWPWPIGGAFRYPYPAKIDGIWVNLACGLCGDSCSCAVVERVRLPSPATEIVSVQIDGEILNPAAYRLDNRQVVIRQDGGSWPRCQNLAKPAGEIGTWTITAVFGRELPQIGRLALAELTCEYVNSCVNPDACALPPDWTSVVQSGISINRRKVVTSAMVRELDQLPEMLLPFMRRFLRSYNPYGMQAPSSVWSPDIPTPTRSF